MIRGLPTIAAATVLAAAGCHGGDDPPTAPVFASGSHVEDTQGRTVVLRGVNVRADTFFDDNGQLVPRRRRSPTMIANSSAISRRQSAAAATQLELPRTDAGNARRLVCRVGPRAGSGLHPARCLHARRSTSRRVVEVCRSRWRAVLGASAAVARRRHRRARRQPAADVDDGADQMSGFFADSAGLIPAYASMTSRLAAQIDQQPGIIGLEIINEPIAPPDELNAFYSTVAGAVRAVAPGLPLYAEPSATRNIVDFAQPPVIPDGDILYAPHLYTGVFQGDWVVGDKTRIEASIQNMESEAAKIHAPIVVTEFGNDRTNRTGVAWLTATLDLLDQYALLCRCGCTRSGRRRAGNRRVGASMTRRWRPTVPVRRRTRARCGPRRAPDCPAVSAGDCRHARLVRVRLANRDAHGAVARCERNARCPAPSAGVSGRRRRHLRRASRAGDADRRSRCRPLKARHS